MKSNHPHARRSRAAQARVIVGALLCALLAVFFRTQITRASDWLLQSDSNRIRPLTLPAPRGVIRDRIGRPIADNVPGYSVSILSATRDSMNATLERLRQHLRIGPSALERVQEQIRAGSARPILVAVDTPFDAVAAIEERRAIFPRVLIDARPKRRYPSGLIGAHIVGSVGEINRQELDSPAFEGAEPGLIVGRSGLEKQYDAELRGQTGVRYVEVDAVGRIVGSHRGFRRVAEEPGADLPTFLDIDLMHWIDRIFPEGMNGAVVALEVGTGGVLALYSTPSYDPNVFAGDLDQGEWERLNQDPRSPLFNRALSAKYPPGSPMKLVTALVALELNVVSPGDRMPVACNGGYRYGERTWGCWNENGHGSLDLTDAIKHSCNVYFYQLGQRIGLARMLESVTRLGFGGQCGIDLPNEVAGTYPASPQQWMDRHGYYPQQGQVLNLSIGQGPIEQTPLMVASYFLAIARDGAGVAPRIHRQAPEIEGFQWQVLPQHLETLREGLRRVTQPRGTAHMSSLEHFDVMGKTGTAQSVPGRPDHAWFGAIVGPRGGAPEIVVVAMVEYGGGGSAVAAPLVAKVADFHLRGVHGIARDTIQTLGEHLRTGTPAPWGFRMPAGGGDR